jgi:hypothetical protein
MRKSDQPDQRPAGELASVSSTRGAEQLPYENKLIVGHRKVQESQVNDRQMQKGD